MLFSMSCQVAVRPLWRMLGQDEVVRGEGELARFEDSVTGEVEGAIIMSGTGDR